LGGSPVSNKSQNPNPNDQNLQGICFGHIEKFGILNFGHWDLPFDLAQGGELVEPFDIWILAFVIFVLWYN